MDLAFKKVNWRLRRGEVQEVLRAENVDLIGKRVRIYANGVCGGAGAGGGRGGGRVSYIEIFTLPLF